MTTVFTLTCGRCGMRFGIDESEVRRATSVSCPRCGHGVPLPRRRRRRDDDEEDFDEDLEDDEE